MSQEAMQTLFKREAIMGFEKGQAVARHTVTTEFMNEGGEAVFLVADSGGASAVGRGNNGNIPTRPDNLNQYTARLQEWHDVPEKTRFNIFKSQGNQRDIMIQTCMKVINRKCDEDIVGALDAATLTWGAASVATLQKVAQAKTMLANRFAGGGDVYAQITPAYHGQLMQLDPFTSVDYINQKPFEGIDKSVAFNWYGVNWIVNPTLPGVGTGTATCYMYNKAAVGHAADTSSMSTEVGYDAKNDKSWARCTIFMASVLMQNSGVIKMVHDDSTLS